MSTSNPLGCDGAAASSICCNALYYQSERAERRAVTCRVNSLRKTILRLDAVCLSLAGILGAMSALLSYTAGSGPLRDAFQGNPAVAGMVEAHALAILVACLLWYFSRQRRMTPGNWIGLFAHAILGAGNILWFGLFVRAQAETVGIAVTVLHLVFAALHLGLLIRREGRRAESLSFK